MVFIVFFWRKLEDHITAYSRCRIWTRYTARSVVQFPAGGIGYDGCEGDPAYFLTVLGNDAKAIKVKSVA